MNSTCTLCDSPIHGKEIVEDQHLFCCHGCSAVYRILSVRKELDNYQAHPLFQQSVQLGLISNPDLLQTIEANQKSLEHESLSKLSFEVQDMWCPSCAEVIRLVLEKEYGIKSCYVDYASDLAYIEYSPMHLSKEVIYQRIQELGYGVQLLNAAFKPNLKRHYLRLGLAAFCAVNVMMFSYPLYTAYFYENAKPFGQYFAKLSFYFTLPVVTYCAWPIYRRFWNALKVGFIGMEALVVMGVTAGFLLSCYHLFHSREVVYFDSVSVIVAFLIWGRFIESKAKTAVKESLWRIAKSLPRKAKRKLANGDYELVLLKDIQVGDCLLAPNGERIVLDGTVVDGQASCDESHLTGEFLPVIKTNKDQVLSGTIVQQGWLLYQVTASTQQSYQGHILQMIERGLNTKPQFLNEADRLSRQAVPLILGLALAVIVYQGLWHHGFEEGVLRAISVMLIACPCAIGIAAPLVESYLTHQLAEKGVIVRNRQGLAFLGQETDWVFDKTGTTTEGSFEVTEGLNLLESEERSILKSMCQKSNHPISRAFVKVIQEPVIDVEDFKETLGEGLAATYRGDIYYLGSPYFFSKQAIDMTGAQLKSKAALVTVYFGNAQCIHHLTLQDRIRPSVKNLLEQPKRPQAWLVSGDRLATVEYVANTCGFDAYRAEAKPLEKMEFVQALRDKNKIVCMFGDGINDAPALTSAHIAVSILQGSEMATQVADLLVSPEAIVQWKTWGQMAIKARKIIKQNLFWAFAYNVLGIGLALAGHLDPIFAAFAMTLSSIIVILNAKRVAKAYNWGI